MWAINCDAYAIPESNPPVVQSSNLRQSADSAAKLSIFRLSRVSVSTPGSLGEGKPMQNCGQVAKSTLSGAPWPISGAQICGWPVSLPPPLSPSACCPLQSFGICRDNNQQRLCVVSKLGRSSCSPWVRVVSLLHSSHKYEHWHWQRGCLLLPYHCCPLQLLLLLLLLSSEIN